MTSCSRPIDLSGCLAYWLGELSADAERELESHLLDCTGCSERVLAVADLARKTRMLVAQGAVRAVVTPAFVAALRAAGLTVREYAVPRNGEVYCTVAPEDDVMIATLEAPVGSGERLDLILEGVADEGEERLQDVPYDPASGRVVISPEIGPLRRLGTATARVRLLSVSEGGERELGSYTFHHSPHPESG